ncbi:MAG: crossover junction endodeoxyribonuclease RuvC [Candidatus Acidiferrales bacterium]|jgi:crossover junction endodeoxyribonuclease RuvC
MTPHDSSTNSNADGKRLCVLGVDPAAAGATGYGVIEFLGPTSRMLRFGALKFHPRIAFGQRLRQIHLLMCELMSEFSPQAVAVESVFTALNMGTALRLAEVRGVILLAAAQAAIPAHSYSPREVKCSVTGFGAASKQQMQQMVSSALGLREFPEPSDAADALAVALCHAHLSRAKERVTFAMKAGAAAVRAASIRVRAADSREVKKARGNHTRASRISGM